MKGFNRKSIFGVLFTLAIVGALLVTALPVAAGSGYPPITVWLGSTSVTIDTTTWNNLKASYSQTDNGTYTSGGGTTNYYSYTGVPVYRLLEQLTGVSGMSGYSALVLDNSANPYTVLVGPNIVGPAAMNIAVKGNNSLIIADSGYKDTTNPPTTPDTTNLPRLVCPSLPASKYYNNNVHDIKLVYTVAVATAPTHGTISAASYTWSSGSPNTNPWTGASPPGTVPVTYNGSQTFNITPAAGYRVATLTIDGGSVTPAITYTFSNVIANHTLAATFVQFHVITATAGLSGSISPSGAVSVDQGTNQTFTITPAAGYQVSNVLVDGRSVGAVTSYTFSNVTANHTIAASFTTGPSLSSVKPAMGLRGKGMTVTITGKNLSRTTAVSFGTGITVDGFTATSTNITVHITVKPNAGLGTRDVSVTCGGVTITLTNAFSVL